MVGHRRRRTVQRGITVVEEQLDEGSSSQANNLMVSQRHWRTIQRKELHRRRIKERISSPTKEDQGEDLHLPRNSDGSATWTTEDQEYFYTDGARRSSTSSEERRRGLLHPQKPDGWISCYFEFSSLQYRVVPVWGWLSLGIFEYRKISPGGLRVRIGGRGRMRFGRSTAEDPGEDLHQRRATARPNHRWKRIKESTFIQRITDIINSSTEENQEEDLHPENHDRINSSMEEDQEVELHLQMIQERFYIDGRRKEGHPLRHQDWQELRYRQNQVVCISLNKISG